MRDEIETSERAQMNILFWNTKKTPRLDIIEDLIIEYNCDIAAFAEFEVGVNNLLSELSSRGYDYYHVPIISCERINIFTKFTPSRVEHMAESDYYTIKAFPHPELGKIIIAFVHFISKYSADDYDQLEESKIFVSDLERNEESLNNSNTIVLGDFNMNPFEEGMLAARALNAFPTKHEVKMKERVLRNRKYKFFYNPMWSFFGDRNYPLGTYYYNAGKHYTLRWNIFDQVIVRPDIMDRIDPENIKIVTDVNGINLSRSTGRPKVSDHFPLFFEV
jgi:hypothetical protein